MPQARRRRAPDVYLSRVRRRATGYRREMLPPLLSAWPMPKVKRSIVREPRLECYRPECRPLPPSRPPESVSDRPLPLRPAAGRPPACPGCPVVLRATTPWCLDALVPSPATTRPQAGHQRATSGLTNSAKAIPCREKEDPVYSLRVSGREWFTRDRTFRTGPPGTRDGSSSS